MACPIPFPMVSAASHILAPEKFLPAQFLNMGHKPPHAAFLDRGRVFAPLTEGGQKPAFKEPFAKNFYGWFHPL